MSPQPAPGPHVVVFDSNIDALTRRIGAVQLAVPAAEVIATPSRTGVIVAALEATPGTTLLIDLCVTDGLSLDRPGERLIQRLVRSPATSHVRPVAWSAHVGPEVVHGVREAGAAGFVTATLRRDREAGELQAAIAGETVWPRDRVREDGWETWFREAYATDWQPWMEPILVRLAAGMERRSVVAELVDAGAANSTNHAATRMREVARIVAAEHSNSASVVARRAAVVLARLAARRPLQERPSLNASLEHGTGALRSAPSLAVAAGLTSPEVVDLVRLDRLIREHRASESATAGAPLADRVRAERRWAAGRLARDMLDGPLEIDEVIAGILSRVDDALSAVDDAVDDAAAHPGPRAAAALIALQAIGPGGIAEVDIEDGPLRWRGLAPAQLIHDGDVDEADLWRFINAADERLARSIRPTGS